MVFCNWLLSFNLLLSWFMLEHVSVLHFFLRLNNVPLCRYTILSICQWMDGLFPLFGYYKWCCYKHLCTRIFVVRCFHFSCVYHWELPGHIVSLHLTSQDVARLFSNAATLFCIPTSQVCRLQIFHNLVSTCHCLPHILSILVGVK